MRLFSPCGTGDQSQDTADVGQAHHWPRAPALEFLNNILKAVNSLVEFILFLTLSFLKLLK